MPTEPDSLPAPDPVPVPTPVPVPDQLVVCLMPSGATEVTSQQACIAGGGTVVQILDAAPQSPATQGPL
jgi:hypothetical protein